MNNDNFYDRFTINGEKLDFYRICLLYEITDPCLQHALKKLLRAGRSHKDIHTDVRNAIDTLNRWEELHPKEEAKSGGYPFIDYPPFPPIFGAVKIAGAECLSCHCDQFKKTDEGKWFCANCGELSL